ncbi:MAG TPA: zf-HC2 domain-containing protein [Bryobacteraceae bacterium]|jgi:anti-sigma factor RsiW|nr:zf-HC2 domain-containing protein [Bryobacteraceae bacterium]
MKCDQVKEHIADYLAGALGRAEAEELDEHFAQCAACKQETEALSQTWEMLGLLEQEQPSAQVGPRFYQSLEAYQQGLKAATAATPGPGKRRFFDWGWQGWAWSAALLVAGLGAGQWLGQRDRARNDLAGLQDEVHHMRQLVTLSLLEQQSASERLRGVDYSSRVDQSDTQVLAALLHAVNYDPNVNVRLAAVDALRKFAGNPSVKGTLDQSLRKQESPMVQLALIDFIVDTRDKTAVPSLAALERNPAADKNVKEKALWGLSQLQ